MQQATVADQVGGQLFHPQEPTAAAVAKDGAPPAPLFNGDKGKLAAGSVIDQQMTAIDPFVL